MSAEWHAVGWVHGRLEWTEEPTPVDPEVSTILAVERHVAALREGQRERIWRLQRALIVLGALAWLSLAFGCAHAPPGDPQVVVLSERAGSIAAKMAGVLVGQEPKAATVPGGPTIVFQPQDADDVCLIEAHEGTHQAQQRRLGSVAWINEYASEYKACRAGGYSSGWCLRDGMELERQAYQAQHACQQQRGRVSELRLGDWLAKLGRP